MSSETATLASREKRSSQAAESVRCRLSSAATASLPVVASDAPRFGSRSAVVGANRDGGCCRDLVAERQRNQRRGRAIAARPTRERRELRRRRLHCRRSDSPAACWDRESPAIGKRLRRCRSPWQRSVLDGRQPRTTAARRGCCTNHSGSGAAIGRRDNTSGSMPIGAWDWDGTLKCSPITPSPEHGSFRAFVQQPPSAAKPRDQGPAPAWTSRTMTPRAETLRLSSERSPRVDDGFGADRPGFAQTRERRGAG
jgi:hypothetical protein